MARTPTSFPPSQEPGMELHDMMIKRVSWRSTLARIFALLFLVATFVPLVGTWLRWDPAGSASNENRKLAEMPGIPTNFKDASKFSERWLSFYRDHFGLRNTLIRAVAETRVHGFGANTDGNVVIGKEGWLFLRPDGDRNFIAYRGLNPLSEDELTAWQGLLERRYAWLKAHGIPYLVVIPPDKQTIYSEFLPVEYLPVRHISRLDQLVQRLQQTHSPVRLLDLRAALLAAKPTALLYHRTDTHWNDSGAFVGYGVIIQAVKEMLPKWNIVPQTRDDFGESSENKEVGDLARMMDMPDQYPDKGFALQRKKPFPIPSTLMDRNESTVMDINDPALPHLVFYRDSFGIALVPMIGPHFGRVVYAFHYEMDPEMIEREKPDLVITEFLERNLYIAPPTDPGEIRHFSIP